MITRADIETEVVARAYIANNSTQFPPARVTKVVQDANLWAGTLHFWPSLQRARTFSSKPNTQNLAYDYYDYPVDFLDNSISRLYIGGKKFDKKAFQDFLDYVNNTALEDTTVAPDPSKHYFADHARQFHVWPPVTVAGSNDGIVWGNIQPLQLGSPTDNTIFSLWDDAGNEAICKKALSILMGRLDSGFSQEQAAEAIQLLEGIWAKVVTELQKAQRLAHPKFRVFDMFGANAGQATIGNFSNQIDISG